MSERRGSRTISLASLTMTTSAVATSIAGLDTAAEGEADHIINLLIMGLWDRHAVVSELQACAAWLSLGEQASLDYSRYMRESDVMNSCVELLWRRQARVLGCGDIVPSLRLSSSIARRVLAHARESGTALITKLRGMALGVQTMGEQGAERKSKSCQFQIWSRRQEFGSCNPCGNRLISRGFLMTVKRVYHT